MTEIIKLIISGSMGAGKTTFISAISDIPPARTDVPMTGEVGRGDKTTTTVAMDYGELMLDDGRKVLLFGTPGQRRYDFMCRILVRKAVGLVILVDHLAPDPVEELLYFVDLFKDNIHDHSAVIGVTHLDKADDASLQPYWDALAARGLVLPIFSVDARRKEDVINLLEVLLATLEYA